MKDSLTSDEFNEARRNIIEINSMLSKLNDKELEKIKYILQGMNLSSEINSKED